MVFTMHFWQNVKLSLLICFLVTVPLSASAMTPKGEITIIHLNESQQGGQLLLDAQGDILLSPGLMEAIDKGIKVYFRTQVEVRQQKSGLMAWHQPVITQIDYLTELSYSRFYQRYTLVNQRNGNVRHFQNINQALNTLTRLQSFPLLPMSQLHPGLDYQIRLKFSVDYWQLNAPLLTHALFNRDWRLASRWNHVPVQLGRI
ncbi:hypothetical protein Thicy_1522 [Thiomicrospira cyclica ALM1]|uniref:Proline rich signal peptide protein n=2 Tax=Thiomicrospira cyclica TaxID=147268 RepID=F6DAM4_THICA|nr:hypothetical protein Thicy_1522 [Thiomicrospira cyclica ALM1]